jgi:integral membrane protein
MNSGTSSSSMSMTPRSLFRLTAFGEAVTWTLLIGGLIARALLDPPEILIPIVGSIHGFVFLSYSVVSILVGLNQRWSIGKTLLAVVLAIVPFATVPFERSLDKTKSLEGSWRKEESEDLRDSIWLDRLFRWFIKRPVVLIMVLVLGVTAVFTFLLWLGPPGEWGQN